MRRVLEIPLDPWGDAEGILSPILRVVYRAVGGEFPVSGKTMFLMLIKENFMIFLRHAREKGSPV